MQRLEGGVSQTPTLIENNPNTLAAGSVSRLAIDAQGNITALWDQKAVGDTVNSIYSKRYNTDTTAKYTVVAGDTWPTIANKVYGDANAAEALKAALGSQVLTTLGNPPAVGARFAVPTSLSYPNLANVTKILNITDPLGLVSSYVSDSNGRLLQVLSPTVNGAQLSTSYAYDSRNNVSRITDANNNITTFSYDTNNNNLILRRDALGNTCTYTYNSNNQLLTETHYLMPDPDGAGPQQPTQPLTTRYVYDSESHVRFVVTGEGRVTESRYDGQGNGVLAH